MLTNVFFSSGVNGENSTDCTRNNCSSTLHLSMTSSATNATHLTMMSSTTHATHLTMTLSNTHTKHFTIMPSTHNIGKKWLLILQEAVVLVEKVVRIPWVLYEHWSLYDFLLFHHQRGMLPAEGFLKRRPFFLLFHWAQRVENGRMLCRPMGFFLMKIAQQPPNPEGGHHTLAYRFDKSKSALRRRSPCIF